MYSIFKKWIVKKRKPLPSFKTSNIELDSAISQQDTMQNSYGELICRSVLSGMGAIEIIRDSLLHSSQSLMLELETINELNKKNETVQQSMQRLSELAKCISQHTGENIHYIDELITQLKDININIDEINKLSRQTNLLAINSAIEAAHFGSIGSGFSVISKEIKQISSEIQYQTGKITQLTTEINQHANNISSRIEESNQSTSEICLAAEQACLMLADTIELSVHMQKIINFIATQQFLNTIKLDHVIWKVKIYELILNKDEMTEVNGHIDCRLGKWFYGKAGCEFSHLSGFINLEAPHVEVHQSGREALSAFRSGDESRLKTNLSKMEEASTLVITQLDELLAQIRPH